jgi:site-specific DNA recombinase
MKAAVYLRISTDREGRELDAERQRVDCLQLAGTLGVDVVEVYLDNDTESSGRARRRRPAYRRMLADAGARRFGTVIAHTSSRLAHLPEEYEDLIELAQRHGTRFAYVMSASSPTIGSSCRSSARSTSSADWPANSRLSSRGWSPTRLR